MRVMLVGRRFWPHGGFDSAAAMTHLATGLARSKIHVEVATAKFASRSPTPFQFRDCTIHRAASAPRSDWTLSRYTRHLTQWLRGRLDSFDVVMVDSIGEESTATLEASRHKQCATVLIASGMESSGDAAYWQKSRATKRCAAMGRMADAVVVRTNRDHRHLLAHQYDEKRLYRVATPIPNLQRPGSAEQQTQQRESARRHLSLANGDLWTMPQTPVLLCHARMAQHSHVDRLVVCARELVSRCPDLRIWFLGDGPLRDRMHSQLRGDGVRANIAMPGSFCCLDDLMTAADAYVQPGGDSMRFFMPLAVAHDLPLIACDDPVVRAVMPFAKECVSWFSPDQQRSLRKQITIVMDDLDTARRSAKSLRERWTRHHPESVYFDQLIQVMESAILRRCGRPFHRSEVTR